MRTINHESSFKLIEGFMDGSSILAAPFKFTYYTKVSRCVYVAEYNGSEFVNCHPSEDGRVIVPFDSPKLGMGALMVKREFFLNDADFADGVCNLVSVESTGITLDRGATDMDGEVNIELFPFYQRGEDGKSAYDLWLEQGNNGTVEEFLASLKGADGVEGANGKSAYQEWLDLGNEGSEEDFLESLKGQGAEIVSSVDELDPDAPQGSLASVAIDTLEEVPFSELYQPASDEVNLGTSVIDTTNLSRVDSISVNSSYDTSSEIQEFAIYLFSKDIDIQGEVGRIIGLGLGTALTANISTQEQNQLELFTPNEDGTITVNEENLAIINNLLSSTEFVYGGVMNFRGEGFTDPSYADVFYRSTTKKQKTELYIKDYNGWRKFKTGSEVVNNLEDGGTDKALSAEMGKVLNEMISNISFSSGADAVTFKGYVNVGGKTDIDKIFSMMKVGDACLCVPSVTGGEVTKDSYLPWILSGLNKNDESYRIPLAESLLAVDKSQFTISNVANLIAGKGEVKTYFTLDADEPYVVCPDLLLLAKVKADLKDFMKATAGISNSILNMIPDGTEMTACIGKVLRLSGGDWVAENQSLLERGIVKNYPYRHNIDSALETGVISYTDTQGAGDSAIGVGGWFTVFVNASADVDSGGAYVINQTAYGRNGEAANRVFTRLLFVKNYAISDKTSWVEITKNTNILPNVNGWLLNPDDCLGTGVYQTCNSQAPSLGEAAYPFKNNYFTMFVNASTSPNGDGWDAIEQTAYGRDADEGKIYRRVIFYHKVTDEKQYKEWRRIDDGGAFKALEEFESALETYITENLTTKDDLQQAIENAITKTLNTAV